MVRHRVADRRSLSPGAEQRWSTHRERICAGVVGVIGFLVAGRAMDRWGRKPTFTFYMLGSLVFSVLLFQTHSRLVMLPLICLAIFFGLGSGAITSAFATEFFPTYLRSRAAAWCRNAFEIPGGIFGPLVVGLLGDHQTGPIGSVGDEYEVDPVKDLIPVCPNCHAMIHRVNPPLTIPQLRQLLGR